MTGAHLTSTPLKRVWINCPTSSERLVYLHTGDPETIDVMKFENMPDNCTVSFSMIKNTGYKCK